MERFTPLYAIAYAILNGSENLRFGKGYLHVLVFYGLFYKRNRNIFINTGTVRYTYRNTRESLGELEIEWKLQFFISHFNFSFSQTSTRVSITLYKHGKCFLFHKYSMAI